MEKAQYAGFWIRCYATFIDILAMLLFISVPLTLIYGAAYWQNNHGILGFWDVFLGYIVPFVATIWLWTTLGATPGKLVAKLKIVDAETGSKLSIGQAFIRYIAYIPAMLVFFLGFIWVAFDKKKQGWHDKIAGTVVIIEDGLD